MKTLTELEKEFDSLVDEFYKGCSDPIDRIRFLQIFNKFRQICLTDTKEMIESILRPPEVDVREVVNS